MDELTHTISITVSGNYQHGKQQEHAAVSVSGCGDIDHYIDAFRAALVASGFSAATAGKLELKDE